MVAYYFLFHFLFCPPLFGDGRRNPGGDRLCLPALPSGLPASPPDGILRDALRLRRLVPFVWNKPFTCPRTWGVISPRERARLDPACSPVLCGGSDYGRGFLAEV